MSNDFLQQRHAAYYTPESVLRSLVKTASGHELRSATPIVQGYANEVYRIATATDEHLIVRIGHAEASTFRAERWAMARAAEVGVPVPHVYATTTITVADRPRDAMVMDAMPGQSVLEVQADLTPAQLASIFEQVGQVLSKLHTVPIAGFGPLDADGRGAFPTWQACMQATLAYRAADVPVLVHAGLTEAEAQQLLAMVRSMEGVTDIQSVLCHADLGTDHVFVDPHLTVCGVIDRGQCQGGLPSLDIALLHMYHPDAELAWLQRGYQHAIFDTPFQCQVLAQQANVGMSYLAHNTREGNTDSHEIALHGMRTWLHQWHTL